MLKFVIPYKLLSIYYFILIDQAIFHFKSNNNDPDNLNEVKIYLAGWYIIYSLSAGGVSVPI